MILFKPVEEEHLEQFKNWRNDLMRYFRQFRLLNSLDQREWIETMTDNNLMYAIYEHDDLIGCAGLTHIDWINRQAELSFYIGGVYCDYRTSQIIYKLLQEAFDRYAMKRSWVEIYDYDPKEEYLISSGMVKEAEIRSTKYSDGKWHDSYIYSMLDYEWRELNGTGNG